MLDSFRKPKASESEKTVEHQEFIAELIVPKPCGEGVEDEAYQG